MPRVYAGALWLGPDGGGCVELHRLEPALSVWGSHHHDVDLDIVEPGDMGSPASLDYRPTLQLQTNFDKECGNGVEVVDNDAVFSIRWIVMVLLLGWTQPLMAASNLVMNRHTMSPTPGLVSEDLPIRMS